MHFLQDRSHALFNYVWLDKHEIFLLKLTNDLTLPQYFLRKISPNMIQEFINVFQYHIRSCNDQN